MIHFDVFNGDADGLCALHQLRLVHPLTATLVTGVKRDVGLLARVPAQEGDTVTVLDVSLDANRDALFALLRRGIAVEYFDHHYAGLVPRHPALQAHIDPAPEVCTSVLVDRHLGGRHRPWAIVGAFGDGLAALALRLATASGHGPAQIEALRELGESINYNAYGESEAELLVPPARLYETLHRYADPLQFIAAEPLVHALGQRRREDLALAAAHRTMIRRAHGIIHVLPDAAWSRRVHGEFGNRLATESPDLAHAILIHDPKSGYKVSVRAPHSAPSGADRLCRQFPSGGGRAAAAGINHLPDGDFDRFAEAFDAAFGSDD